jgi:hypothetical protein
MVEPILVALKEFDGKGLGMGKAWFVIKTLEKHMESLGDPPFSLPQELAIAIKSQFQHQWRMMKINLHYVGAILTPIFLEKI